MPDSIDFDLNSGIFTDVLDARVIDKVPKVGLVFLRGTVCPALLYDDRAQSRNSRTLSPNEAGEQPKIHRATHPACPTAAVELNLL